MVLKWGAFLSLIELKNLISDQYFELSSTELFEALFLDRKNTIYF